MPKFNKEEFGNNLRKYRKLKGLTQANLGRVIGKADTTIMRFETGRLLPNAEEISLICDELGITEYDLFKSKSDDILNIENSKNPFKTKELYLYYIAYSSKNKDYKLTPFKLILRDKPDRCECDFTDYKTGQIYMSGHILSDTNVAIFVFENYKEYSPRLEVTEIILNISNGINGVMLGSLSCTNGQYVPSIRKCAISKTPIIDLDELEKSLLITENEITDLKENNILYLDTNNKYDFED